jgi:charged multivesicular body protein 5
MSLAAKDLKKHFKSKELDINHIDKLADEMADLMGMSNDIQDALGQNYSVPDDINEDELMGELDSLEFEMAAEKEAAPNATPSYLLDDLPEAPAGTTEKEESVKTEAAAVRM